MVCHSKIEVTESDISGVFKCVNMIKMYSVFFFRSVYLLQSFIPKVSVYWLFE